MLFDVVEKVYDVVIKIVPGTAVVFAEHISEIKMREFSVLIHHYFQFSIYLTTIV